MALTMAVGGVVLCLMTPRSEAEVGASSALGRWINLSPYRLEAQVTVSLG